MRLAVLVGVLVFVTAGCVTETSSKPTLAVRDSEGHIILLRERINFGTTDLNGVAAWHIQGAHSLLSWVTENLTKHNGSVTAAVGFLNQSAVQPMIWPGHVDNGHSSVHAEALGNSRSTNIPLAEGTNAWDNESAPQQLPSDGWIVAVWAEQDLGFHLSILLPDDAVVGPGIPGNASLLRADDLRGGARVESPLFGEATGASVAFQRPVFGHVEVHRAREDTGALDVALAREAHRFDLGQPATQVQGTSGAAAWFASDRASFTLQHAGSDLEGGVWILAGEVPPEVTAGRDVWTPVPPLLI